MVIINTNVIFKGPSEHGAYRDPETEAVAHLISCTCVWQHVFKKGAFPDLLFARTLGHSRNVYTKTVLCTKWEPDEVTLLTHCGNTRGMRVHCTVNYEADSVGIFFLCVHSKNFPDQSVCSSGAGAPPPTPPIPYTPHPRCPLPAPHM